MIHTDRIDYISAHGTGRLPRTIRLADDTTISVHAGNGAYSTPRPRDRMVHEGGAGTVPADYPGPYSALEVYVVEPLTAPAEWAPYNADDNPTAGLFCPLPVDLARALVVEHGGEHVAQDTEDDMWKALAESFMQNLRKPPAE
ncbi:MULTISPECIES: hypothetical protein [unclassified Streptomyces]|uniref:hypothetical protein n=1 Tax=unclassified Streptomyces TaxID=2593676 RepID=UPI0022570769|nr:hypothetical protein [Streptomyces sp. NBC_01264]MCX4783871.1 hypothetical protein [Streptomyces sp. NBC_01264]